MIPGFFAQEIPCDTDYQLALPVPPEQQGVDYVVTYLAHLAVENRFLQRYPRKVLCPVWEVYCPPLPAGGAEPVRACGVQLAGRIHALGETESLAGVFL